MNPFKKSNGIKKQVNLDNFTLNFVIVILAAIIGILVITGIYFIVAGVSSSSNDIANGGNSIQASADADYPFKQDISIPSPDYAEDSAIISGIHSPYAVLVDVTDNKIIASKASTAEIYPASMTKVMSLIVIFENLQSEDSLNDKLTVTQEYYDRKVAEQHSGDIITVGKEYTVKDMIYNLILKSDGIAAMALADYVAGSESAFVDLMNEKAAELGLEKTQFKNPTGMHEKYHLTTAKDMAVIMMYAMKNPFCAEVLSAMSHTNSDGTAVYHATLVSRLNNDRAAYKISPNTVNVTAAKSGWAGDESGHCLVTFAEGKNGHKYILVTAKAETSALVLEDMLSIYNDYAK